MFKKVRIIKLTDNTKSILEHGKVYEVIREKRDEYLVHVNDAVMVFVWKSDAEIVEQ